MTRYNMPPADDPSSLESFLRARRGAFKTTKKVNLRDGAWEGVLCVEGRPTGDGREFARGALTWDDPPLTLTFQPTSHGGVESNGVVVGRIDRVWRQGDEVWGEGVFDLRSPDGAEVARQVAQGFLKGVSVDVDDMDLLPPRLLPGGLTEVSRTEDFERGRIRGAAVVGLPAFVEAQVWLKHLGRGNLAASGAALLRDLASVREAARDPRNLAARLADGADERAELRRRGWTNGLIDRATAEAQDVLQRRVHPLTVRSTVTAGALGPSSGTAAPAVASSPHRTGADLRGMVGNLNAARDAGLDPARLWPGQAGLPGRPSTRRLLASAGPDRPIRGLLPPVAASFDLLTDLTTSGANRRAPGGRAPRRTRRRT